MREKKLFELLLFLLKRRLEVFFPLLSPQGPQKERVFYGRRRVVVVLGFFVFGGLFVFVGGGAAGAAEYGRGGV